MLRLFRKEKVSLLVLFFYIGGMGVAATQEPMKIPVDSVPLQIKTEQGVVSYEVEVAFSTDQSAAGLMYRTSFPKNRAMLFKNSINEEGDDTQKFYMWMANTYISLDMIFLNSEGIIVSIIEKTSPLSTNIISSEVAATFAIEINAGEVFDKQIQKGQRVIHPAICGKCESE
ncbi:DUF192 domain-containing protein [Bartonella ancashensis]|uniref:Exported protein n=1 Tax=Bartonella ancashensis TaxID=1318743 RepID=A0A0M4M6E7_9HYPH|nr:DUF192 domain-containing protein [Bartonella ancashensis]ALE03767.1 exported protein [Bartonella ancashensis]